MSSTKMERTFWMRPNNQNLGLFFFLTLKFIVNQEEGGLFSNNSLGFMFLLFKWIAVVHKAINFLSVKAIFICTCMSSTLYSLTTCCLKAQFLESVIFKLKLLFFCSQSYMTSNSSLNIALTENYFNKQEK